MTRRNVCRGIYGMSLGLLLLALTACGGGATPVAATSTPEALPTETSLPTQTPVPLYQIVTLDSVSRHETSESPAYTLDAAIPALQGSEDSRVATFNSDMNQVVAEEVASFKDNARMVVHAPGNGGSFIDVRYELLSPWGNLVSLRFETMTYIEGAAHPGTHSRSVTYDLEAGAYITLDQLFLPGSDYLGTISRYCIAELQGRDIGFDAFAAGAQPVAENYGSWNITQDGLLITFDEYQVAAYAAGAQEVVVPYAELQAVIDPDGPLKAFVP